MHKVEIASNYIDRMVRRSGRVLRPWGPSWDPAPPWSLVDMQVYFMG